MEETKYVFSKAVKELLQKQPLDKITVTDIVTKSQLSRQTFYRHFIDKYDLVNWYFEKLVMESFKKMGEEKTLEEALLLKFSFIKKEHSFFKVAFNSNDYNNLKNYDFDSIYRFYLSILGKGGDPISTEILFLLRMYCKGSIDMTVEWILNDMPEKVEDIVSLLIAAIPPLLKEAFERKNIM